MASILSATSDTLLFTAPTNQLTNDRSVIEFEAFQVKNFAQLEQFSTSMLNSKRKIGNGQLIPTIKSLSLGRTISVLTNVSAKFALKLILTGF